MLVVVFETIIRLAVATNRKATSYFIFFAFRGNQASNAATIIIIIFNYDKNCDRRHPPQACQRLAS